MGNVDPSMFLGMLDPPTQSAAGSTTPTHRSFHPPHALTIMIEEKKEQQSQKLICESHASIPLRHIRHTICIGDFNE